VADRKPIERFRPPSPSRFVRAAPALGLLAACGGAVAVAYLMGAAGSGGGGSTTTVAQPAVHNFPDAHDEPVASWTGPVFQLSQAYPTTLPAIGPTPWKAFDFRTQTNQYLKAVLDYALEGNTEVDFRGQDNSVRKWYHAPWLHAGDKGREFVHGMTHERSSRPGELAPTQTRSADNWAVGMYNPRGGFVLGQVWKNRDNPDPRQAKFPDGTVGFKLLFTAAPVSQVPFLKNDFQWPADIHRRRGASAPPRLRLVQIDVAVRDSRADSTTGWVFGTFIYNGNAPGATPWDRMVPVGAMWGNDPDRLTGNQPLRETFINPDAQAIVQHLGFRGRLNGPIDNPKSSCLSCHSTAEVPTDLSSRSTPGIPPNTAADTIRRYFRNIRAQSPFTPGELSLDYSLQLQNGIANWANETGVRFPAPRDATGLQRRIIKPSDKVRIKPVSRD
jgi:hypothetical protein